VSGSGAAAARVYVLMHVAIFDAVNGIGRRYTPYHVDATAPRGASRRAAAIAAAYNTLLALFPSQKPTLDAELLSSLASLSADDEDPEDSQSIDRGFAWGQQVASDIQGWRSSDGFNTVLPPLTGDLRQDNGGPPRPPSSPWLRRSWQHDALRDRVTVTVPSGRTFRLEQRAICGRF